MGLLRVKKTSICILALVLYIVVFFYLAVLSRASVTSNAIKLELFWGYKEPTNDILREKLLNIICFIPIGALVGLIAQKRRIAKALAVGLLVSLLIECSQLIWHRGTFDVDDLFNNTVGAFVGGVLVLIVASEKEKNRNHRTRQTHKKKPVV